MSSSESEVDLNDLAGQDYLEISVKIERLHSKQEDSASLYPDPPSPTPQERKQRYNYHKFLKEYEMAALSSVNNQVRTFQLTK